MDPISLLKEDHATVKDLFRRFNEAPEGSGDIKWDICQDVIGEITVHSTIEERIFYPALREIGGREENDLVAQSLKEHEEVTALMDEINEMGMDDPDCEGKFQTLIEKVEGHIQEEEDELFPTAQELLADRFEDMAEEMTQLKRQIAPAAQTRSAGSRGG